VWSHAALGVLNLPARVGRLRVFGAFPRGGLTIVARAESRTASEASADIDFIDERGRLIARIEDCGCTLDPALVTAFASNDLGDPG
jgi:hypothetical protein